MNLAVLFRAQLQNAGDLGATVLRNLEDLVTKLTSWGQAEHHDDGTHADVTATSAVIDLASLGRFRNHKIAVWDNAIATDGIIQGRSHYRHGTDPPIAFQDAGVIVIFNSSLAASGVPTVLAMDGTGRQTGEVVWFMYVNGNTGGPFSAIIRTRAAAVDRKDFAGFIEEPVAPHDRLLAPGRVLPVMYLDAPAFGLTLGATPLPGWCVGAGVT